MLIASLNGARVEAESADRGLGYSCPGCHSEVSLKRGAIKTPHFAHKARPSCGYASGESAVHMAAKLAVLRAARQRGLRAEVEYYVSTLSGDRRADVMVWSPSGQRIAIEVQHSSISLDDIYRRSESYTSAGIAVIWLPILDVKMLNNACLTDDGSLLIKRYEPPHWQRWISGYSFGRLWIMTSDLRLWAAQMNPHIIRLPGRPARPAAKVKDLLLFGPFDLADTRFRVKSRAAGELGQHKYPGGPTAEYLVDGFTHPKKPQWQGSAAKHQNFPTPASFGHSEYRPPPPLNQ